MNRKSFVRTLSLITSAIALLAIAVLFFVFKQKVLISLIISVIFIGVLLVIYYSIDIMQNETNKEIENRIDADTRYALSI